MSQLARSWNAGWSSSKSRRPCRTKLPAMSLSFTFAVLLICGVAALGLVLLIMLVLVLFRATAPRSGG